MQPFVTSIRVLFLGLVASAVGLTAVGLADAAPKKPAKPAKKSTSLVGTWKSEQMKDKEGTLYHLSVEFHDDGTYTSQALDKDGESLAEFNGEYTYSNGQLTMTGDDGEVFYKGKIKITGKKMVFNRPNGPLKWVRVDGNNGDQDGDQ